jgi:hypothetical protein
MRGKDPSGLRSMGGKFLIQFMAFLPRFAWYLAGHIHILAVKKCNPAFLRTLHFSQSLCFQIAKLQFCGKM